MIFLLKKVEEKVEVPAPAAVSAAAPVITGPTVSKCVVEENGKLRTFKVTIEPIKQDGKAVKKENSGTFKSRRNK